MKTQKTIYILVIILLILSACTQVSKAAQNTDTPSGLHQTDLDLTTQPEATKTELKEATQPEVTKTELVETTQPEVIQTASDVTTQPEATPDLKPNCFRNSDETRLLINDIYGYCFQYPAEYDVVIPNPTEVVLFKKSVLNATDPNFYIDVQPADGITVEQAAEKLVVDYTVPGLEVQQKEIMIDGVKAIVLDGLTGQDPNRQVVVVRNDTLYRLYFVLMSRDQPEVVAQAEELYNTVIQTFNFHPECNAYSPCP